MSRPRWELFRCFGLSPLHRDFSNFDQPLRGKLEVVELTFNQALRSDDPHEKERLLDLAAAKLFDEVLPLLGQSPGNNAGC